MVSQIKYIIEICSAGCLSVWHNFNEIKCWNSRLRDLFGLLRYHNTNGDLSVPDLVTSISLHWIIHSICFVRAFVIFIFNHRTRLKQFPQSRKNKFLFFRVSIRLNGNHERESNWYVVAFDPHLVMHMTFNIHVQRQIHSNLTTWKLSLRKLSQWRGLVISIIRSGGWVNKKNSICAIGRELLRKKKTRIW